MQGMGKDPITDQVSCSVPDWLSQGQALFRPGKRPKLSVFPQLGVAPCPPTSDRPPSAPRGSRKLGTSLAGCLAPSRLHSHSCGCTPTSALSFC